MILFVKGELFRISKRSIVQERAKVSLFQSIR